MDNIFFSSLSRVVVALFDSCDQSIKHGISQERDQFLRCLRRLNGNAAKNDISRAIINVRQQDEMTYRILHCRQAEYLHAIPMHESFSVALTFSKPKTSLHMHSFVLDG